MTLYLDTEYVVVTCGGAATGGCDVQFAMTRSFYDRTKTTGEGWYCPNGHSRIWTGPTTKQKLKDAEAREVALRDQLHAAEADAEATRVRLLRDRHRFANGVCPCCNRSFDNVRRHMESKHPDYDASDVGLPVERRYKCSCGRSFETPRGLAIHQGRRRPDDWMNPRKSRYSRHLTVTT